MTPGQIISELRVASVQFNDSWLDDMRTLYVQTNVKCTDMNVR